MAQSLIVAGALAVAALVPVMGPMGAVDFAFATAAIAATQKLPKFMQWGMAMAMSGGRQTGDRSAVSIAQEARDLAMEAKTEAAASRSKQETHEAVCAERYGNIRSDVSELKSTLTWAMRGGLAALVALAGDIVLHLAKIG